MRLAGLLGVRGLLFALCGAAAVWLGYFAVSPVTAGHLIISFGYYYILGVFCLFIAYARRLALDRRAVWTGWLRSPGPGGLAIAAGTAFALWSDRFQHKILFDEFDIQSTAYEMHLEKAVSTIVRAYRVSGTWLPIDKFLDKRPYFLPFLVSLAHDLTGFRVANIFILNAAFGAALLALLYWFTRQLAGRGPAILAVALMATLPLFGQNATGAGMDLHNLMMVALVACLGVLYLRVPSGDRLALLVIGAVLLTQSRYESIIFVAPVAFIVVAGWVRAGRVLLPWPAIAAPLLLVPCAWHLRVVKSEPIFFQLQPGQAAFTATNVPGNFRADVDFLFSTGTAYADSVYLTALGVLGIGWLAWAAWRRLRGPGSPFSPAAVAGLAFGAGIAAHFVILLFYWWSKFNDPVAARFALPMCLAFSVLAALLVSGLSGRGLPALRAAWLGLAAWLLAFGLPAINLRLYTVQNLAMQELDWEESYVAGLPGPVLVISNKSTIPFLLRHVPSVLRDNIVTKAGDIRYHMGEGTFNEVIVTQAIRPAAQDGFMGVDPDDALPPGFHLKMLAERRFGGRFDRISRVVSVDPQPEEPQRAPAPAVRSISELQSSRDPSVAALTSPASSR